MSNQNIQRVGSESDNYNFFNSQGMNSAKYFPSDDTEIERD